MLEFMRQRSRSWLVYLLFGIIIAVFILTFNPWAGRPLDVGGAGNPMLAEIGEHEIDLSLLLMGLSLTADPAARPDSPRAIQQDFLYRNTRFYYAGGPLELAAFGPDPQKVSPIKLQKVVEDFVETYLTSDLAIDLGLAVSVDEITERVLDGPRFKDPETGEFDPDAYTRFVRFTLRTTKKRYEDFLRREVLRERLIYLVRSLGDLPSAQKDFLVRAVNEKIDLEYVELDAETLAPSVEIPEEEATAWASANADKIKTFYEANLKRYDKPERVTVRGIFLKAPFKFLREHLKDDAAKLSEFDDEWKKASEEATAARKAFDDKLAEAGDTAKPDEIFAEVAGEKSQHDKSKANGGLFEAPVSKDEMGRWPFGKQLAAAAFDKEPGTVVGPVEADNGYWIVRIESRIAAEKRPLDSVQAEIVKELLSKEHATKKLEEAATTFLALAKEKASTPLEEIAAEWSKEHGLEGDHALVVQDTGSFGRVPAGPLPPSPERLGEVPRIGLSRELHQAAFALTAESPVADKAFSIEGQDSLFVVRLKEAAKSDEEGAKSARDRVAREVQPLRARLAFRGLVDSLKSEARKGGDLGYTTAYTEMLANELKSLESRVKALPGPKS
jgi:peptidyl-prolyl cis-trans isomerase D